MAGGRVCRRGIDTARNATPGGELRLNLPLDGGSWGDVELVLGAGPQGATLAVTPSGLGATIGLLPAVTGLSALAGGGAQLLLAVVLNELVGRLGARPGGHQALDAALQVAAAFGLYGPTGFDGERLTSLAADLAAGAPGATTARQRAAALAAVAGLLAPGASVEASGGAVTLTAELPTAGSLALGADLGVSPPGVTVELAGAAAGAATADLTAGPGTGSFTLAAAIDLDRGLWLRPSLSATAGGAFELRPLGDDSVVLTGDSPTERQAALLATGLGVPLAAHAALGGLGAELDRPLWSGGPTPAELLEAAGLTTAAGDVVTPPPRARDLLDGVLGLLEGAEVPLSNELVVALARARLGVLGHLADGLLGYFVAGDHGRLKVVDPAVADLAAEGQPLPAYVDPDPTFRLQPASAVILTLLMVPGSRVHATTGLLPRKAIALQRGWTASAMSRISPTTRRGPVLCDTAATRLPVPGRVRGTWQWHRRTDPTTWITEEVVPTTTEALLPEGLTASDGWLRLLRGPEPDYSTAPFDVTCVQVTGRAITAIGIENPDGTRVLVPAAQAAGLIQLRRLALRTRRPGRPAIPLRPVKLPGGYRTVSAPHGLDDELLNLPRC